MGSRTLPAALFAAVLLVPGVVSGQSGSSDRVRARDLGIQVGVFPTGDLNTITDVADVRVGHATVAIGDSVNTGVTAILPHGGNLYREPVPAAMYIANGYGKLLGIAQVNELGVIETPILLTCTLCVWKAADALVEHMLSADDMQQVRSINAVVGETNDGFLNDIRSRPIDRETVREALAQADNGPVAEGSVGAGRGTIAFGWKGGIGTSSRVVPYSEASYTVGVLVQSNYGGILTIDGAPVGETLEQYAFRNMTRGQDADGSIMIVVAVDAPLTARQLERIAKRSVVGLARTGASMSNGSGDFVIAFSTHRERASAPLPDGALSPLFQATAEAAEEAIYNSILMATDVKGHRGSIDAISIDSVRSILKRHGVID